MISGIISIIIFIALLAIIFLVISPFIGEILFGKPELMNELVSKYQQSKQIRQHIQKDHNFPNPKCGKIECLNSWKETEKEIVILEKKQSKLVRFIIRPKKKGKN